jgi:methionine sulfoxide reductase heme-binding subunit
MKKIIDSLNQLLDPISRTLLKIHPHLIKNRGLITTFFVLFYFFIMAAAAGVGFLVLNGELSIGDAYEIGQEFGEFALYWYVLSLVPGMISRFKVLPVLGVMTMLFRRQFGKTMLFFVLGHYFLTTLLPTIITGEMILDPARTAGFIAMIIAIILWITSFDFMEKKLGHWWKKIHNLTYLILLLIFAHLILFMKDEAVIPAVIIIVEAFSWMVHWWRKRTANLSSE